MKGKDRTRVATKKKIFDLLFQLNFFGVFFFRFLNIVVMIFKSHTHFTRKNFKV